MTEHVAVTPGLLVIEDQPDWAPELARQFPDVTVSSMSANDWTASGGRCASPVVSLMLFNVPETDQRLALRPAVASPPACVVVLAESASQLEPVLRELGVSSVWFPGDDRGRLIAACRKLLAAHRS